MDNALGESQTIVLLGGTSDIGRAIVTELMGPSTSTVVLAGRHPDEAQPEGLARPGITVETVTFDAADTEHHEDFVQQPGRPSSATSTSSFSPSVCSEIRRSSSTIPPRRRGPSP